MGKKKKRHPPGGGPKTQPTWAVSSCPDCGRLRDWAAGTGYVCPADCTEKKVDT